MAEPEKAQITVDVSQDEGRVIVELDPETLIGLRPDDAINTVSITLAGEPIALLQRFAGPMPGSGDNTSLN